MPALAKLKHLGSLTSQGEPLRASVTSCLQVVGHPDAVGWLGLLGLGCDALA